jgi:hypothetical protein
MFKKMFIPSLYVATPSFGKITLSPLRSRGTRSFSILQVKGGKVLFLPYLIIVLSLLLPDLGYLLIRDLRDLLTGKWVCSSWIGGVCSPRKWGYFANLRFGAFPHLENEGTWSPPGRIGD